MTRDLLVNGVLKVEASGATKAHFSFINVSHLAGMVFLGSQSPQSVPEVRCGIPTEESMPSITAPDNAPATARKRMTGRYRRTSPAMNKTKVPYIWP